MPNKVNQDPEYGRTLKEGHKHFDASLESLKDELEKIRIMPIGIPAKRKKRDEGIKNGTIDRTFTLCGNSNLIARKTSEVQGCCANLNYKTTLFAGAMKKVENHFGGGVYSYFSFLKLLLKLNLLILFILFVFLVLPMAVLGDKTYSYVDTTVETCSTSYETGIVISNEWYQYILDALQGTGHLENTILYYGYYEATVLNTTISDYTYNLPLAYIVCTFMYMLISLLFILYGVGTVFKESEYFSKNFNKPMSNRTFAGWQHAISHDKSAKSIREAVVFQLKLMAEERRMTTKTDVMTSGKKCCLWTTRILINILILGMLGGAGYLIYYVSDKQAQLTTESAYTTGSSYYRLTIDYMTTLVITALNLTLEPIFFLLVKLESYKPTTELNLTLLRTILPRLASVAILVASLYESVSCEPRDSQCDVGTGGSCPSLRCWETFTGQQFYRLVIMSFVVTLAVFLVVEIPRSLIVSKCSCTLSSRIGYQQFNLVKNILDLIYLQILLWFGSFFSPLLPIIVFVVMLLMFGIKYLATMKLYKPTVKPYRSTDSRLFFMILLFISFFMVAVPIFYVVYGLDPSRGCGPFRSSTSQHIYLVWKDIYQDWTYKTLSFMVPIAILFGIMIYLIIRWIKACRKVYKDIHDEEELEHLIEKSNQKDNKRRAQRSPVPGSKPAVSNGVQSGVQNTTQSDAKNGETSQSLKSPSQSTAKSPNTQYTDHLAMEMEAMGLDYKE